MNLIGVFQAADINRTYENTFAIIANDWLKNFSILALKSGQYSEILVAALKFLEELTNNRGQRINFSYACITSHLKLNL